MPDQHDFIRSYFLASAELKARVAEQCTGESAAATRLVRLAPDRFGIAFWRR